VVTYYAKSPVSNPRQLAAVVARTELGTKQPLEVIRDGKEMTLSVTVKEMPKDFAASKKSQSDEEQTESPKASSKFGELGLEVAPLTADQAKQLGLKVTSGVAITSVDDDSPAGRAGLEAGMLVERVGNTNVKTVEDFQAAVKNASLEKGVLLLVRTSEGSRFVVLKK
jgi:serine protease Do